MRVSLIITIVFLLCITACDNADNGEFLASADSTQFAYNPTSLNSPSRKIVKQADLKCRTNNIMETVAALEQTVRSLDGLVSVSEMNNQQVTQNRIRYKPDSLKEVNIYRPTAVLKLRIPVIFLDSILKALPAMVDFIEYRNIRQDDLTLAYLSNALKNEAAVSTPKTSAPTTPKYIAKADSPSAQNTVIDRRIENLQILDDVNYTKLSIELTQPEQVYTAIIPDAAKAVSESFFTKFRNNISIGWEMVLNLLAALITLWPFILLALGGWWFYKLKRKQRITTRLIQ